MLRHVGRLSDLLTTRNECQSTAESKQFNLFSKIMNNLDMKVTHPHTNLYTPLNFEVQPELLLFAYNTLHKTWSGPNYYVHTSLMCACMGPEHPGTFPDT